MNPDMVSVLEYWDKYRDEYYVFANGIWINPYNGGPMPNLNPSKEIPLVVYTDIYLEDDIYSLGEFDITNKSCSLKDTARSLSIETVKAQWGIITIDPNSEFDDAVMELGIRKYARVEKDSFGFFAPNINASSLEYIESKVDEDIIIESGVDFRSQLLSSGETATKTEGKIRSALKRISLNIKWNAYTFYERLARLRMANMNFYSEKALSVPVKGMEIDNEGWVQYLEGGYGLFTMKPEYFKGKMNLMPRIDSMVGSTSEDTKQKFLNMFQLLINLVDRDTGKPLYDPKILVEAGRWIIDDVINLDKIAEKQPNTKSAEQILNEMDNQDKGLPTGGEDLGGVPPAQRSGRPIILPSNAS